MIRTGTLLVTIVLLTFCVNSHGAATPTSDDLWDISKGTVVTTLTPVYPETSCGIFGGTGYQGPGEAGNTLLNEAAAGYLNVVEWKTAGSVSVQSFRLFARGDLGTDFREFAQFTVKCKTGGSSTYNTTLFSFTPTHPYTFIDPVSYLVFETNLPSAVTAQEFRAEVVGYKAGARVIELDAFGPPPTDPPSIIVAPKPVETYRGKTAEFSVGADGAFLSFQWQHEETNLVQTARIAGVNSANLRIEDVSGEDAGNYRVIVSNQFGTIQSTNVSLTLLTDTNAPVIVLTGPGQETVYQQSTNFIGTVSDESGIQQMWWELNGNVLGTNTSVGADFSIPMRLEPGTNNVKIFARDTQGNERALDITRVCIPITQSSSDLWDLSQGTEIIANPGMYPQDTIGMLGGAGMPSEPGRSVFADNQTNGFTHFLEWRTKERVTVTQARLFAFGDAFGSYRSFSRFTVLTKSEGSTNYDTTVFNFIPESVPPPVLAPEVYLTLLTNFPAVTGQEFRAEIVQFSGGPRIVELDAFGEDANSPPQIAVQPADKEGYEGGAASFSVTASGANSFTYQWRHEGTNLVDSSKYSGTSSSTFTVNSITSNDEGLYSVVVKNHLGTITSSNAVLRIAIDTQPPAITIISPTSGTNSDQSFVLSGTIVDNDAVTNARWEMNGIQFGALNLNNGQFSVAGLKFTSSQNQIRVIASDRAGNTSTNELTVTWSPARALVIVTPPSVQEGGILTVPVSLVSTGGVSGMDFAIRFDTNYLTEPQFNWLNGDELGLTSVNLESNRVFRASFAGGNSTIAPGTRVLANMVFRTRSVGANTNIVFTPTLTGIYADSGDPFTNGNFIQGTSALITKRKFVGDNNANDRLDVGDASLIMRLITGIDRPRSWDVAANDLNKTLAIDSGDVIRVLRVVVGIDPQPQISQSPRAFAAATSSVGPLQIIPDKPKAVAGEKITLSVLLTNQIRSLTGISFEMDYPTNALKLENATAQQLGPIVPSGVFTAWNVSPNQNDYAAQDGRASLAVSAATTWPSSNGVVAKLTFTVQANADSHFAWPVTVKNVEISRPDFQIESLSASQWTFVARDPQPAQFTPAVTFNAQGTPILTLQGDIGATYVIEVSSDLQQWQTLGVFNNAGGPLTVEDTSGLPTQSRFYRAVLQQP